jgi:large subunit ribosomal protein L9
MKIILLKDVAKIGKRYETKEVADGFAVNSLIPQRLAIAATPDAVKRVALELARETGEKKVQEELIANSLAALDGTTVVYTGKTNDKGHLFAGLHAKEIAALIGFKPEHIMLDKPLKEVGDHAIKVKVADKTATFTLSIKSK